MGIDFLAISEPPSHIRGVYYRTGASLSQVGNEVSQTSAAAVASPFTCSDIKFLASLGFKVVNNKGQKNVKTKGWQ